MDAGISGSARESPHFSPGIFFIQQSVCNLLSFLNFREPQIGIEPMTAGLRSSGFSRAPSENESSDAIKSAQDGPKRGRTVAVIGNEMATGRAGTLARIKSRVVINANGCWLWQGALNSQGYGQIAMMVEERRKKLSRSVHRVVAEVVYGPIPDGKIVCHTCDVRECCNPEHLYIGTSFDNARDAVDRGRAVNILAARNAAKTQCPKGHPYDDENTGVHPRRGYRYCKACRTDYDRRRRPPGSQTKEALEARKSSTPRRSAA